MIMYKSVFVEKKSYMFTESYVICTHQNRLDQTILMSTNNIG